MILTLEIDRQAPSVYLARLLSHGGEVTKPSVYERIADAIRQEAADVPEGFAHFIEVRYQGFSSGTETLESAHAKAEEIASTLTELVMVSHNLPKTGAT